MKALMQLDEIYFISSQFNYSILTNGFKTDI